MISEAEIVGRKVYVTLSGLSATSANQKLFVVPSKQGKYRVVGASARWATASSSAKLQVEVAGSGVAAGSGVNQLDTALDTSGTADVTVQSGVSTPTIFDYTSALNLIFSGTKTSLADCVITVELEKVL